MARWNSVHEAGHQLGSTRPGSSLSEDTIVTASNHAVDFVGLVLNDARTSPRTQPETNIQAAEPSIARELRITSPAALYPLRSSKCCRTQIDVSLILSSVFRFTIRSRAKGDDTHGDR